MAFEQIKLDTARAKPGFWAIFAMVGIPLCLFGWSASGKGIVGVAMLIVGLLPALIIWSVRRNGACIKSGIWVFAQRGYRADYQLNGLLVDSNAKMLAFVNTNRRLIDIFSTRDVLGWEHQWTDKTRTQVNAWGNYAHSTTDQVQNTIVIKTNNPANPIYRVPVFGYAAGQTWMARLSAVING